MLETEVLVVGAGPVGLATACQLARLGARAHVIDALTQRTTQSRAVGIQARSLEMLASLDVLLRLEQHGRRMRALEVISGRTGSTRAHIDLGRIPSRHPYVLDVAQPDTEAVLEERAAELGVVVERGVELTALVQDDQGVDVTMRSAAGDRVGRFGWVVGADGAHSATRHLLGTHLEGVFQGHHFAMADVHVDTSLPPDAIRSFLHPDGMGFLFPMAGTRARIMFFVDAPPPGVKEPTWEQIRALADERMGGLVRVHDPYWLTYFEVHHAQVPHYRHGRVLLAGDAAHVHSPIGAQGMNTGIQDAANLAWKLALVAQGRADAALLDSYQNERHPIGASVVRNTARFTAVGGSSDIPGALRDVALFLAGHLQPIGKRVATNVAELTVGYRNSALSVQHGAHRRAPARAGDHAPDPVGLLRLDSTPVSIEELLIQPGMLVLLRTEDAETGRALRQILGDLGRVVQIVNTTDSAVGEPRDCLVDPDDAIGREYGLGPDGLALIRPDGYIGLIANPADPQALRHYLRDTLGVVERAAV
ncbi:FAD-dependent monooxygenase [Nakamurella sp.]|uniref:FAD-dependent monooxygenase n=1 Tax=Nakamurella sp. TaxID=1869182 RepID=UPI0037848D26